MIDNLKDKVNNNNQINNLDYSNNVTSNQSLKINKITTSNEHKFSEINNISGKHAPQKKVAISQQILNFILAIASVVTIGVSGVINVFEPKTTVKAEIVSLEASVDSVYYNIEIYDSKFEEENEKISDEYGRDNYNQDYYDNDYYEDYDYEDYEDYYYKRYEELFKDVYVVVYNNFTNRVQQLNERYLDGEILYFEGYEENLKPNMTYTIEVRKGKYVLAKKTFKTMPYEEEQYEDDPYAKPDDGRDDYNQDDYYEDPYEDDYGQDDGSETGSLVVG